MDELVSIEDTLLKTYPQIYDLFRKYQDAQIQIMSLSNGQEFVRGFKVGAQIALEMRTISNNINQIAKKANETNSIFAEDMQIIKKSQDELSSILSKFICNCEWNDV